MVLEGVSFPCAFLVTFLLLALSCNLNSVHCFSAFLRFRHPYSGCCCRSVWVYDQKRERRPDCAGRFFVLLTVLSIKLEGESDPRESCRTSCGVRSIYVNYSLHMRDWYRRFSRVSRFYPDETLPFVRVWVMFRWNDSSRRPCESRDMLQGWTA